MTEEEKKLLKPLVWDASIESVDLKKHKRWLISRIMVFGMPEHVRWMLKNFNEEDIKETVMKSKTLDVKTANFWSIHFNIDKSKVLCLNKPSVNGYF